MPTSAENSSPVDGFYARIRRNPVVASAVVVGTVIIAVASFTDAANKLLAPFRSQSPAAARTQLAQMNLAYNADTFVASVASGDATAVRLFLVAGMDPSTISERQGSALGNAAFAGRGDLVTALLDAGAKLRAASDRPSALESAAAGRHPDVVKQLLDRQPPPDAQAIDEAFVAAARRSTFPQERDYVSMKLLAERGARVAAVAPDIWQEVFERGLNDPDAAEVTRVLLELGADPNGAAGRDTVVVKRMTPLMGAASEGYLATAQLLLARGARVDVRYDRPEVDDRGWTALMLATRQRRAALVRLLIAKGADIEQANSAGDNALLLAARHGDAETMQAVLDKSPRIDATASDGRTALMLLVEGSRLSEDEVDVPFDALKALMQRNPRVDLKAKDGTTALMVAAGTGVPSSVKLLLAKGARPGDRDAKGRRAIDYARSVGDPARQAEVVRLLRAG